MTIKQALKDNLGKYSHYAVFEPKGYRLDFKHCYKNNSYKTTDYVEAYKIMDEDTYNREVERVDFEKEFGDRQAKILCIMTNFKRNDFISVINLMNSAREKFGEFAIYEAIEGLVRGCSKVQVDMEAERYKDLCCGCCGQLIDKDDYEEHEDKYYYEVEGKKYHKDCLESMDCNEMAREFNFGTDELIKYILDATVCRFEEDE